MDSSSKYRLRTCYMPGKVLGSGEPEMKDTKPLLSKAFIHSCLHSLLQQRAPTITKVLREKQKDKRHESKLPENQNLKRANWTAVQLSHFTDGKTEPGEVNNLLVSDSQFFLLHVPPPLPSPLFPCGSRTPGTSCFWGSLSFRYPRALSTWDSSRGLGPPAHSAVEAEVHSVHTGERVGK